MQTRTLEPLIREHRFLQGLDDRYIQLLAGCARNLRFAEGQIIFREGDPAEQFYLIQEGRVAIELRIPHRGLVTVQTVGEGEVLGLSWLLPSGRWQFDARTQQPTHAVFFDAACLREKCREDHEFGYEILNRFTHALTERLHATRLRLLDLYGVNS